MRNDKFNLTIIFFKKIFQSFWSKIVNRLLLFFFYKLLIMHYLIALFNIDARKNKFQIKLRIKTFFDHINIKDQMFFYYTCVKIIRWCKMFK